MSWKIKSEKLKGGLLVLGTLLVCSVGSANFYEDRDIPAPQAGETVCQAYVAEYSVIGDPFENGLQIVRALPEKFCKTGKAVEGFRFSQLHRMGGRKLRVAAVGDFYTFQSQSSPGDIESVDPAMVQVACRARLVNPEGRVISLSHLEETQCFAGNIFRIDIEGISQWVHVEVAYDFHYAPENNLQVAEVGEVPLAPGAETGASPERVVRTNYGVEI